MTIRYIDVHILQSVPPSNLNRDDTGSPKSAVFGGTRRARVSSQAWKRRTRLTFNDWLEPSQVGVRTKQIVAAVAEEVSRQAPDLATDSERIATEVLAKAGLKLAAPKVKKGDEPAPVLAGYLVFLSALQVRSLAELGVTAERGGGLSGVTQARVKALADRDHSVDCALFGRMVAEAPDLNVDAACQVAHSIGVHAADTEFDYFTAVDDRQGDDTSGAGMIGTVEFLSTTLYRYATVDLDQLRTNLGSDEAVRQAVHVFVDAFVSSMPTGKQNTFAHRTLPDAVVVALRDYQPINCVGAFERAVSAAPGESGYVAAASRALAARLSEVDLGWGQPAVSRYVARIGADADPLDGSGEKVPMNQLGAVVAGEVAGSGVPA